MRDVFRALRLQRWIRQLDAGMVCGQESVVLFKQGEGMSTSSWRMCVSDLEALMLVVSALLRHLPAVQA